MMSDNTKITLRYEVRRTRTHKKETDEDTQKVYVITVFAMIEDATTEYRK